MSQPTVIAVNHAKGSTPPEELESERDELKKVFETTEAPSTQRQIGFSAFQFDSNRSAITFRSFSKVLFSIVRLLLSESYCP